MADHTVKGIITAGISVNEINKNNLSLYLNLSEEEAEGLLEWATSRPLNLREVVLKAEIDD